MKKLLYLVLSLITVNTYSQSIPLDPGKFYIPWHSNYKLKWSDFKGESPNYGGFEEKEAGCAAELLIEGYYENGPKFKVTNNFNAIRSFTKDTTSISLLRHEQIHFDIAEIYCRKIRKGISELEKSPQTSLDDYTRLIKALLKERNEYDSKYDLETNHGVHGIKQLEWREKVDKELAELIAYYASNKIYDEED